MNLQCVLTKIMLVLVVMASLGAANYEISKAGCEDECGGVKIPYPFGIGDGCYSGDTYRINCTNSSTNDGKLVPVIADRNRTVLSISLEDHSLRVSSEVAYECYRDGKNVASGTSNLGDMYGFNISASRNMLVGIGCDATARVWDSEALEMQDTVGCITSCSSPQQARNGTCSGRGCCATSIFNSMEYPNVLAGSTWNYTRVGNSSNDCSVAFVAEASDGSYEFSVANLKASATDYEKMRVPVVFNWCVNYFGNCSVAKKAGNGEYLCGSNTNCFDQNCLSYSPGYRCQCNEGYAGNPYLSDGCQDINECSNGSLNVCETQAYCVNKLGSYDCKCPNGFHGNATKTSPCIPTPNAAKALTLGLSIGMGSMIGGVLLFGLYKLLKRRKKIQEMAYNFKENGGLLLKQDMSTNEGVIERTKIFNQSELEKATDNFNDNRVLGRGGQGTVYKGMLEDGTIVAVKKSQKVDENQLDQFINEVVILSQINHRNIVKLFGCCLETKVPLLIYEFVPNGTLYQHIHHPSEDFRLTWKVRFQIALECAGAIAYLHSSCSSPIYHRDIKSSNILLDEKYRAKISDFGTSKTISIDKTHVTTCVQGTFGYLDPEFFQSSQFTEKSDVYSFGVVLLELLTSKKPIFTDTSKVTRGLAPEFLQLMETSPTKLHSILGTHVLQHSSEEEIKALAKLIKRCLSLHGKQRPTMKEVTMTLEMIKSHNNEEGNSSNEQGIQSQIGQVWTDQMDMSMTTEGTYSISTTSAFTDTSHSKDEHPLLFYSY